ncbi:hypothetical protein GRF61_17815 [Azoarcus sp. TTM-91]|uniref:hypothetical protein n=1 Tax=Azoarcus sp. TTM-91 TaxID=2691581 RepID=UPI00145E5338|nr:hypothetical protein [Azoarcus sp. TTM-91]NMG36309.1 hypothetical protein [Azoarcus sp. TTM-91]
MRLHGDTGAQPEQQGFDPETLFHLALQIDCVGLGWVGLRWVAILLGELNAAGLDWSWRNCARRSTFIHGFNSVPRQDGKAETASFNQWLESILAIVQNRALSQNGKLAGHFIAVSIRHEGGGNKAFRRNRAPLHPFGKTGEDKKGKRREAGQTRPPFSQTPRSEPPPALLRAVTTNTSQQLRRIEFISTSFHRCDRRNRQFTSTPFRHRPALFHQFDAITAAAIRRRGKTPRPGRWRWRPPR